MAVTGLVSMVPAFAAEGSAAMSPRVLFASGPLLPASGGMSPVTSVDQFTYIGGPVWRGNGFLVSSEPRRTLVWGPVALVTPAGTITCRTMSFETLVSNQGVHGLSQSEGPGAQRCTDQELERKECPVAQPGESRCAIFLTAEMPILRYQEQEGLVCKIAGDSPQQCPESELERRTVFTKAIRRPPGASLSGELEYGVREEERATLYRLGVGAEGKSCYPKEKTIVEGHEVELPASWESVPPGCIRLDVVAPRLGIEPVYYGALEPRILTGSKNGLFPSTLVFGNPAGELVSSEGAEGEATLEREMTIEGAAHEELIGAY